MVVRLALLSVSPLCLYVRSCMYCDYPSRRTCPICLRDSFREHAHISPKHRHQSFLPAWPSRPTHHLHTTHERRPGIASICPFLFLSAVKPSIPAVCCEIVMDHTITDTTDLGFSVRSMDDGVRWSTIAWNDDIREATRQPG